MDQQPIIRRLADGTVLVTGPNAVSRRSFTQNLWGPRGRYPTNPRPVARDEKIHLRRCGGCQRMVVRDKPCSKCE